MNLKPFQLKAIESALRGESLLISAPTGAGKTAITEGIAQKKKTVLILPLVELIKQQYQRLQTSPFLNERKIYAFHSGLNKSAQSEVRRAILEHEWDVFLCTPEFIGNNPGMLDVAEIIVFDEVHAGIMGGFYRSSFWQLLGLLGHAELQIVMMTGTVTPKGETFLMNACIGKNAWNRIAVPIERPNLELLCQEHYTERHALTRVANECAINPINHIVICRTKTQVAWLQTALRNRAVYVTGESSKAERLAAQEAMFEGRLVIGTSLIGTGLDFPNIDKVSVVGAFSLSDCIQFMGRAGRANQDASSTLHHWEGMVRLPQEVACCVDDSGAFLKQNPVLFKVHSPGFAARRIIELAFEETEGLQEFCFVEDKQEFIRNFYLKDDWNGYQ